MARISRREFMRRAAQAGLAAGIGSHLGVLTGCGGEVVDQSSGQYDAIVVGGGTAGTIVAAKLQMAGGGRKRILVDASLIPTIVPAHPVGTILAVADRAGDILAARWS